VGRIDEQDGHSQLGRRTGRVAEVFSGSVRLFGLSDILGLLTSRTKTGLLSLERGTGKGEIYVEEGSIVHAKCKNEIGEEAVFNMLAWRDGMFNFVPDVTTENKTIRRDTASLLEEGAKRLEEWEQIKEIVPSEDMVFRLSSSRAPDEITIRYDDWSVLSQVDGNKTVGEISNDLKIGEYDTARIVYKLFVTGLIEVATEPKLKSRKTVDPGFLDFLEERLTEALGPVAPVILEEEIAAMGEERGHFPLDKSSLLVQKVSGEIDDDAQRTTFQKMVLGALRGI